jgi:hypothetical protein
MPIIVAFDLIDFKSFHQNQEIMQISDRQNPPKIPDGQWLNNAINIAYHLPFK